MLNFLSNCICCGNRANSKLSSAIIWKSEEYKRQFNNNIDDVQSTPQMNRHRNIFNIFHKYPQFLENYCLCLHRKVEPADQFASQAIPANNSIHTTPIIPVVDDIEVYVELFSFIFFFSFAY